MKSAEFTLRGQAVSGKNAVLINPKTGRHYPAKKFAKWRGDMTLQIMRQFAALPMFNEPVKMTVRYVPGDLFRRDATGILDAIFNLLEHVRMLKDDCLVKEIDYREEAIDRANPRTFIRLDDLSYMTSTTEWRMIEGRCDF